MLALRDRLLLVEDDFLSALAEGEGAISAFNTRWEGLIAEVDTALESAGLDKETSMLVHTVAFRIATLADASAEIYESNDSITSELIAQIDDLVSQITLEDALPCTSSSPQPSRDSIIPSTPLSPSTGNTSSQKKRFRTSDEGSNRSKRRRTAQPHALGTPEDVSLQTQLPNYASLTSPPATPSRMSQDCPTRKRRLSDADISTSFNPSKRLHVGPRLHAVSDSFPVLRSCPPDATPALPRLVEPYVVPDFVASLDLDFEQFTLPSKATLDLTAETPSCQLLESFDFISPQVVQSDTLDAFLASLLTSDSTSAVVSSPARTPIESASAISLTCRPSSRSSFTSGGSVSRSPVASRGCSPSPSPLATPPSSPLPLSTVDCTPLLHELQPYPISPSQPNSYLPDSYGGWSSLRWDDLFSEVGWRTLFDMEPSAWITAPLSSFYSKHPSDKHLGGDIGTVVASTS